MEDNLHMLKELQTHAFAEGAHSVLQIVDVQVRNGCLALLSLEARCDLTRFASERAASESLCHDLRCQDQGRPQNLAKPAVFALEEL